MIKTFWILFAWRCELGCVNLEINVGKSYAWELTFGGFCGFWLSGFVSPGDVIYQKNCNCFYFTCLQETSTFSQNTKPDNDFLEIVFFSQLFVWFAYIFTKYWLIICCNLHISINTLNNNYSHTCMVNNTTFLIFEILLKTYLPNKFHFVELIYFICGIGAFSFSIDIMLGCMTVYVHQ